jgi:hypothetical protein
MQKWLQRIRGAVGIGLTWAAGWAPLGAITGWVTAAGASTLLGAGSAAGTLAIAKAAHRQALPQEREETASVLT